MLSCSPAIFSHSTKQYSFILTMEQIKRRKDNCVILDKTCDCGVTHPLVVGQVIGSNLGSPNHVITKDDKNSTYCCYVRCTTKIVKVVGDNALATKEAQLIAMHSLSFRLGLRYIKKHIVVYPVRFKYRIQGTKAAALAYNMVQSFFVLVQF